MENLRPLKFLFLYNAVIEKASEETCKMSWNTFVNSTLFRDFLYSTAEQCWWNRHDRTIGDAAVMLVTQHCFAGEGVFKPGRYG